MLFINTFSLKKSNYIKTREMTNDVYKLDSIILRNKIHSFIYK